MEITEIMTPEELTAILLLITTHIALVFLALDTVIFVGAFSILDIFIGIKFLDLIIGYILEVLRTGSLGFGVDPESTGADISDPEAYSSEDYGGEMRYPTR